MRPRSIGGTSISNLGCLRVLIVLGIAWLLYSNFKLLRKVHFEVHFENEVPREGESQAPPAEGAAGAVRRSGSYSSSSAIPEGSNGTARYGSGVGVDDKSVSREGGEQTGAERTGHGPGEGGAKQDNDKQEAVGEKAADLNVVAQPDTPNVPCTPKFLCRFRIAECKISGAPRGWFRDVDFGGPEATTSDVCKLRKKVWEEHCKTSVEMYTMYYNSCENKGFETASMFRPVQELEKVGHAYITLWLHQVQEWFAPDEEGDTMSKVKDFLTESKKSGFTELMTNLPWPYTEREGQGKVDIDNFNKGDVISTACDVGLRLHVVVDMSGFPPWLESENDMSIYELGSHGPRCTPKEIQTHEPSSAHAKVWTHMRSYVNMTSQKLLQKYGNCITSISPTMNNEFETRYIQTNIQMRDYSQAAIDKYKQWQLDRGLASINETVSPPGYQCKAICEPNLDKDVSQWLGFREESLSNRYMQLCKVVKTAEGTASNGKSYHPDCLLHIGEFFSTTDSLNSNLFFKLAKSDYVDHLVMDSNMALFGAPTNPSIVGIMVSVAQAYGKIIHYEAATERILKCDNKGKLEDDATTLDGKTGASLLIKSGIARGLEAGVHQIGVTNLCAPGRIGELLSEDPVDGTRTNGISLRRASSFKPSAVLFVPYRAFYTVNMVISGWSGRLACRPESRPCWHESFAEIPRFGAGETETPTTCNVDVIQEAVIQVWEDLRTRHPQVAVISEPDQLTPELLKSSSERVLFRFPCVMTNFTWNFFEGEKLFSLFQEKTRRHPFSDAASKLDTFWSNLPCVN